MNSLSTVLRPFAGKVVALALLVMSCSYSINATAQRVLLDKIVAVVDGDVVLQSELDNRMRDARGSAERSGRPIPPEEQFQKEILDLLILENLQMQFADRVSIRFDDDTVNRVLLNMARNNNMDFEQYVSTLEQNGVYLQTRDEVRRQMTLQELQRGMVNRRITITDQEIENFLNSETGREVMAPDFLVEDILIPSSSADSAEVKSGKRIAAADLVARIRDGESFAAAKLAIERGGIQLEGSSLGWRKENQLPNLFSDVIVGMEVAEVEGPIEAGNGFHVILLTDKRGGTDQMVDQTNIRHILLTPNEIRNEEQTKSAIDDMYERISNGEDFASIARQNSDDPSSVVAGGDLDWINDEQIPPEMAVAVTELEVNVVSEPFRTTAGWHIAEVLGRRETDLSLEFSRMQAENALRNRKFDLELQNWLIEIREEAFVELVE